MPGPAYKDCQKGFTFIEVIVAMVIIGLATIPIMNAYTVAHRTTGSSNHETTALYLAQGLMEETLAQDFNNIINSTGTFPGHSGYTYTVTVTEDSIGTGWQLTSCAGSTLFKQISVTVTYPETSGTKTLSLTTEKFNANTF